MHTKWLLHWLGKRTVGNVAHLDDAFKVVEARKVIIVRGARLRARGGD